MAFLFTFFVLFSLAVIGTFANAEFSQQLGSNSTKSGTSSTTRYWLRNVPSLLPKKLFFNRNNLLLLGIAQEHIASQACQSLTLIIVVHIIPTTVVFLCTQQLRILFYLELAVTPASSSLGLISLS